MTFPTIPTAAAGRIIGGTQTGTLATRTFPNLNLLTGKAAGDLLIAIIVAYQSTGTPNAVFSGWSGGFTEFGDFSTTSSIAIGCAYKWSTGSETGQITVTQAATITGEAAMILMSIPGAHATTPPAAGGYFSGTSVAANPGALDPAGWGAEDTLWLDVGACGETATTGSFTGIAATNPTSYSNVFTTAISADVIGGVNAGVAFRQLNAASEDPDAFSTDTSQTRAAAITIAVRPVSAPLVVNQATETEIALPIARGIVVWDFDWNDVNDVNRLENWIYNQEGATSTFAEVDPAAHTLTIGQTGGANPISNQRELWTIPETGTWELSSAVAEIRSTRYSGSLGMKPQHGFGLRAQQTTVRRAILVWHDTAFGIANAINLGVWQANLDGTGFTNRQANGTFDLIENRALSSASRTGGVVTFQAATAHSFVVGDYVNTTYTREFASTAVVRASNVVTATVGSGHQFQTGDSVTAKGSSPSSFDGTFTLTGTTTTTVTWAQTAANESGTTTLQDKSSDVPQAQITEIVNTTTFRYTDGKHDLTSLGTAGNAERLFPYWIEVRLSGTVVNMRSWSRHQTRPAWLDVTTQRVMAVDLNKANATFTVTASSRTSNVTTLTIGAHTFAVGNRIDVDITDASGDTTNGFISAVTGTTVSYPNTGANNASLGTGTCTIYGGGSATDITTVPTPLGAGRVAIVSAHMGTQTDSFCKYGDVTATNSATPQIIPVGQAIETEIAQPITTFKSLAATSQSVAEHTAALNVALSLTATSQAVAEHTAALTVSAGGVAVALDATSQAVAEHTASLALALAFDATSQAVAEQTADLSVTRGLDAVSQAVAEHAAAVTVDRGLTATSQAVAEHTAELAVALSLAATSQAVAEHAAALNLDLPLSATSQAVAEHTAALTLQGQVALDAVSQAVSEHTAALTLTVGLSATSQAVAEHTAALNVAVTLTATSQAVAEHTAELTVQVAALQLDATSQAVAEHTAVMVVDRGLAATSSSVAEHTATLSLTAGMAGTMQAVAEATAALTVALALAAVSEAVAGAAATLDVSVFLAGRPTLTAVTDQHTLTAQTDRRTLVAVQE